MTTRVCGAAKSFARRAPATICRAGEFGPGGGGGGGGERGREKRGVAIQTQLPSRVSGAPLATRKLASLGQLSGGHSALAAHFIYKIIYQFVTLFARRSSGWLLNYALGAQRGARAPPKQTPTVGHRPLTTQVHCLAYKSTEIVWRSFSFSLSLARSLFSRSTLRALGQQRARPSGCCLRGARAKSAPPH